MSDEETPSGAAAGTIQRYDAAVSIGELAAQPDAMERIEKHIQILARVRKAALHATSPAHWVKFKTRDGLETLYLDDCGGELVRKYFGIRIFDVGDPLKITTGDPREFGYSVTADGVCALTGERIERITGIRTSTEDFCKDRKGIDLEKAVQSAARANCDGRIVRELAGLSNVPLEEVAEAWVNTGKSTDRIPQGRGYGTGEQRQGRDEAPADTPDVSPVCRHCKKAMQLRKGSKSTDNPTGHFYSCPDFQAHKDAGLKSYTINLPTWRAELAKRAPAATPSAEGARATDPGGPAGAPKVTPPSAEEVFGSNKRTREPGEEG